MSHLPSLHLAMTATRGRCHQNHNLKKKTKEGERWRLEWERGERRMNEREFKTINMTFDFHYK